MSCYRPALLLAVLASSAAGGSCCLWADDSEISPYVIRDAIRKSIPLLEKGAAGSAEQRQCFTCHNQALPVLALAEARKRGFAIDEQAFQRQIAHTEAHLERGQEDYLSGRGQGGKVLTAGYALWTLDAGENRSAAADAVVRFLLDYQKDASHWKHRGNRPPSSGSDFTATYVALRGVVSFGTEEHQSEIRARIAQVRDWILNETTKDTEDRVFRLLALPVIEADKKAVDRAAAELIGSQQDDGGWAQMEGMDSDAYATGAALTALLQASNFSPAHPSVRRAAEYLVNSQLDDGSWHVTTRAEPFQTYFESGFPHGEDQFISIAASSWTTLALLKTLPDETSAAE